MTAKVIVSGFVQGVRYRKFVEKKAKGLGLRGWVKNLPDTRVEAYFSGEKELIEKIIEMLWEGSFLAQVRSVNVEWEEDGEDHSEFIIVR